MFRKEKHKNTAFNCSFGMCLYSILNIISPLFYLSKSAKISSVSKGTELKAWTSVLAISPKTENISHFSYLLNFNSQKMHYMIVLLCD